MVDDPFNTLGLPARFGLDSKELDAAYRKLSRSLHPDRHVHAPPGERRRALAQAIDVGDAYRLLKDPGRRARWLLDRAIERAHASEAHQAQPAEPEFLMDIMQRREALSEARQVRDLPGARALGREMQQKYDAALADLTRLLDDGAIGRLVTGPSGGAVSRDSEVDRALAETSGVLSRLGYYRRFLDEVASIEDELD